VSSVIGLKLVDDIFNVEVDGGLGNRQLIGNLFIAIFRHGARQARGDEIINSNWPAIIAKSPLAVTDPCVRA
jgi:hypothetical protein